MTKSSAQTRDALLDAATLTLQTKGFAGATSRAIARESGLNQALIFYHFGSVDDLLLSALERTSNLRLARYRERLGAVDEPAGLLQALAALYEEDRNSGHMTVVAQMLAGSLTRQELAPPVLERIGPWLELARETIARALPPLIAPEAAAYAAITFYLGVNLLASLDPRNEQLDALFEHAHRLAPLLATVPRD